MEKRISIFKRITIAAAILLMSAITVLSGRIIPSAYADSSDILAELTDTPEFNAKDYPVNNEFKTVEVIQIAESSDSDLLVYTYQPNADSELRATSIVISRKAENADDFHNYDLEYIDSSGVFFKYKVQDFALEVSQIRYYNISNILRPFIPGYDVAPEVGSISERGFAVGKLFTAVNYDDTVKYFCKVNEVITITEKYVGFMRYKDGHDVVWLGAQVSEEMTDAHFVSFSCDRPIDELKSVRLSYTEQQAQGYFCFNEICPHGHPFAEPFNVSPTSEPPKKHDDVVINADDTMSNTADYCGMFKAPSYTWNCIQKTADVIADDPDRFAGYNEKEYAAMSKTDWTVFFAETNVFAKTKDGTIVAVAAGGLIGAFIAMLADGYETTAQLTQITDVLILQLTYEYDGKTYSMGVVDSKQSGSGDSVNKLKTNNDLVRKIIIIVLAVLVLILIVYVLSATGLLPFVVRGVVWVVTLPVRLIQTAVKNSKKGNKKDNNKKE